MGNWKGVCGCIIPTYLPNVSNVSDFCVSSQEEFEPFHFTPLQFAALQTTLLPVRILGLTVPDSIAHSLPVACCVKCIHSDREVLSLVTCFQLKSLNMIRNWQTIEVNRIIIAWSFQF